MHRLTRTVRFNLPAGGRAPGNRPGEGANGESGKPPMEGLGVHYSIEVRCEGEPDPETGYLINIKEIDTAVHGELVPLVAKAVAGGDAPSTLVTDLLGAATRLLHQRRQAA